MLTSRELRAKRVAAGISGYAVCRVTGDSRSKLSAIERGEWGATEQNLQRISDAIDLIIKNRQRIAQLARTEGIDLIGVGL